MNYFILFVILLVFSETPLSSSDRSSNRELYSICSNQFKCGNVVADFPFWGGHQRPRECGYPGLELHCDYNDTAILEIIGVRYRVLHINPETKRMRIAREDYEGGFCPQNIQNTTLDAALFDVAPGSVCFTLLYDCPPPPIPNFPIHEAAHFNCNSKSVPDIAPAWVFIVQGDTGPLVCNASATVLVREDGFHFSPEDHGGDPIEEIERALENGFEVEWKVDEEGHCQKCNNSKGKCGIDHWNRTVCYCQEPSSSRRECLPLPPAGELVLL